MPLSRQQSLTADEDIPDGSPKEAVEIENASVYQSHFSNPITRLAGTIIFPLALLIAVSHIFYAGVAPGDGFTAGVIAGLGITLWFIVLGYEEAKKRLHWLHPAPLIGMGLVVAIGNATLPLLFGRDFFTLTQVSGFSLANIKFASSVIFEIGIFIAVFGGISAIMEAVTHPGEVEPL
jgi:multisubunit Na+/H+ antiporter MnhB subunit